MKRIIHSLYAAFSLLTRIPIPFSRKIILSESDMAGSVLFFPLVGLFYGIVLYFVLQFSRYLNLSLDLCAFIVLALPYVLNRFFHLDGLSDLLDGFLADRDKASRLEIMKDSRVGSFALGGISLYLLFKWLLIKEFLQSSSIPGFILLIPILSRYGMALLAAISRYPRENGTGKIIIGRISPQQIILTSFICVLLTTGASFILYQTVDFTTLALLLSILPATLLFRAWSNSKIGGITGDGLGAFNEMLEIFLLILCFALMQAGANHAL